MAVQRGLIAGADPKTRSACAEALKKDFDLKVASTATELAQGARDLQPSVCIVDMGLVRQEGIKLLRLLREADPDVRVVLLTERRAGTPLPKALREPNVDYVVKPFAPYELQHRVRTLLDKSRDLLRKLDTPREPAPAERPLLAASLRSDSGRLDARRIAEYLDVPLRDVAAAVRRNYTTVHKKPDAVSLQSSLQPFWRIASALEGLLPTPADARKWLNQPHPSLGDRTPLEVMLEGRPGAVQTLLHVALEGEPA